MDPYKILGVDRNATIDDIKNSYRKLAGKHHPDRGGDTKAFQEIQAAYDILSDPNKRAGFDNPMPQYHSHPGSGNPFQDMINEFMRQTRQRIYTVTIFVTLEQVINGSVENVHLHTPEGPRLVQIQIPSNIMDGQQVRYEGILQDGSLQVQFRIHKHPKFERHNNDLHSNEEIDVLKLITGTKIIVSDIFGSKVEMNIPPMTKPGSKFRLPGKGLKGNGVVGDQYVLIVPILPDKISIETLNQIKKEVESNKT